VAFDVFDSQPGRLQRGLGLLDGPGIREAGDTPGEPRELRVEPVGVQPHIGDADTSPRTEGTGELGRRDRLVGKGAEGALADGGVEHPVLDRKALRVADLESGPDAEPSGGRAVPGSGDLAGP
jgi:hypothetical protein